MSIGFMNETSGAAPSIAYFSMEICLDPAIPTYSGGLGVLAGDTLRSAADLKLPMVGVTLLHRKGYFRQRIDAEGNQTEAPEEWRPEDMLQELPERASVTIEGRDVQVRAWRYSIRGVTGHEVPVLLLDTALPSNSEFDRTLTDTLYGGDGHYRLCQEIVLGMGGAQLLRAIGMSADVRFHMNEGHSALLSVMLLEWRLDGRKPFELDENDVDAVRRRCVFTTHTPVPAGHDVFAGDQVRHVLGEERKDDVAEDSQQQAHGCHRQRRAENIGSSAPQQRTAMSHGPNLHIGQHCGPSQVGTWSQAHNQPRS